MNIAVIGAGSLGLLFASKLSPHCRVELVTRTEQQAAAIRSTGIAINTIEGQRECFSDLTVNSFERRCNEKSQEAVLDFLFLMVKQTAIQEDLISFIQKRSSPSTIVICFQNGLGHVDALLEAFRPNQIMLAVTTEGASKLSIASAAHMGVGITYLGYSIRHSAFLEDEVQKKCCRLLKNAGFAVSLSNNMDTRVWGKLIINSVINPLTAILRVRNGELLESQYAHSLMVELFQESLTLAAAAKVELLPDLWDSLLGVCRQTAQNQSSMLQDLLHNRETEIEYINGSMLRLAVELQVAMPVHQTIHQVVKALENK
jgi:2-dehydropantoate 2-reductase